MMKKEIILKELKFTFSRSSGSGGQHVNKVATKAELAFDVPASDGLKNLEKKMIEEKLANRITQDGILKLEVSKSRSQLKNRQLVTKKFFELISKALTPEKKRKKFKPSAGMIASRLKSKKHLSDKKNQRKKVKLPKQFDLFSINCVSFVY